jgi:nitrous oxide reductase accessory protein NosL
MNTRIANIIYIVAAAALLASCRKEGSSITPANMTVDTTMANVKYRGTFANGPYGSVTGTAKISLQNSLYSLALENVTISNGPDLHVYLSGEVQPVNYIDLGRLQSVSGNQVYSIPGTPDFTQYKYALIHCQRFNHLFGSAELR